MKSEVLMMNEELEYAEEISELIRLDQKRYDSTPGGE